MSICDKNDSKTIIWGCTYTIAVISSNNFSQVDNVPFKCCLNLTLRYMAIMWLLLWTMWARISSQCGLYTLTKNDCIGNVPVMYFKCIQTLGDPELEVSSNNAPFLMPHSC